ncbi:hormogonium polysaccharide biosynthesis glycosyltransferase HpsP [Mastigocoleus sp. MO_188.B34]|uniref:hormogonium polysaccharide biosynthesis glycosyltransferase HpsP n=1 Tax=Mastigocoleus sp. MO_188.B34 TaxID=3036635 RepID=UPI0026113EC3|nr:hormogonium polysaccharide biosynthesis glycosyltransferase HpsP [Mastigocoleus sp. MO_188.B34]MDJ0697823.1 hormogonium polysaccharide biosynthesis glycosyltransferase HpsP [Mastigocoleus sp. MO_188.B34]
MRILQIVPSISLIYGGPSQMILGLAPALAQQGIRVTVITTNSNGDTGQETLEVPLNQVIEQDGYQIIYFKCAPFRRYKFSIDLFRWLNRHAHEFDLAHIHALFSPISSIAATICRRHKLPYILRPLGTLDPADLQKKRKLKQLYAAVLESPNLANAAAVHFTSEQEAKVSERFGRVTKDLILPLGVAKLEEKYSEVIHYDRKQIILDKYNIYGDFPLILFMSRIDPKKGLDVLIPALEKLLSENFKFHFVLAGTNPQNLSYEQKIKKQIEASELKNCTTITGFVTGELKSVLLQAADLFVLPSYYENFGIAVAEAMVVGTPVAISDQVHISSEVRDSKSGWVCEVSVQALANILREALRKPEERQYRGLQAQQYALQHYSWDAIASKIIMKYRDIISQNTIMIN